MSYPMKMAGAFFTAFLFTAFILPRLSRLAKRIGLLDIPNVRKVHNEPKPLVGGLGMMMAVSLSSLIFIPLDDLRGYFAGMILLVITGFLDDFRELDHKWKFAAQIGASLLAVFLSNAQLHTFGDLLGFGDIHLGVFSIPVTVFCMVGVINAFNMIDGLDGLAGLVAFVGFATFGLLSAFSGNYSLLLLSLAMMGSILGFLRYNWFPSTLFMGDAGSMALGYSLAFFSIALTQKGGAAVPPVAPLMILAVPITDAVIVMTKRMLRGRNPFIADTNHLHHNILFLGYSKKTAVESVGLLVIILSGIAAFGTMTSMRETILFGIFVFYLICHGLFTFTVKKAAFWQEDGEARPPLIRALMPHWFRNLDPETGLLNEKAITENLEAELEISKRDGDLSFVLLEHPDFSGKECGGAKIRIHNLLRGIIRKTDIVGLYKDWIALILPE
ncbi:MAG: hypothetical protein D6726_02095, partial [Nitrospirae bacterium]